MAAGPAVLAAPRRGGRLSRDPAALGAADGPHRAPAAGIAAVPRAKAAALAPLAFFFVSRLPDAAAGYFGVVAALVSAGPRSTAKSFSAASRSLGRFA